MDEILSRCINDVENGFGGTENTDELFQCVEDIVPLDFKSYKVTYVKGTTKKFKCEIKANINKLNNETPRLNFSSSCNNVPLGRI